MQNKNHITIITVVQNTFSISEPTFGKLDKKMQFHQNPSTAYDVIARKLVSNIPDFLLGSKNIQSRYSKLTF